MFNLAIQVRQTLLFVFFANSVIKLSRINLAGNFTREKFKVESCNIVSQWEKQIAELFTND